MKRVTFHKIGPGHVEIRFTPVGQRPRDENVVGWLFDDRAMGIRFDREGWRLSPYGGKLEADTFLTLRDAKSSVRATLEGR